VAGALAERVFAKKLENVGFTQVEVVERHPFSLRDAARYPLFTPGLVRMMRAVLPPAQQEEVATAITIRARRPL
jgi:arsenite methyltransferase